jgi:hypothetical protein
MQWFVNEVREKFEQMNQRIEGVWKNEGLADRVEKLEVELRAMKMRMGKQKQE